jgi:hypothetical protein
MTLKLVAEALEAQALALTALAAALKSIEPQNGPSTAAPVPPKRGRGRPVAGEAPAAPAASPEPAAAPAPEPDPFAGPAPVPVAAAPTATLDEARTALTALSKATSQPRAVEVMKESVGVTNLSQQLTPEQYWTLRDAALKATPSGADGVAEDPFAGPAGSITDPLPAPAPKKEFTIEEVKAVITKAGTKVSQDTLMKIVVKHGGKAKNPETGVEGPSLKALPPASYAAVVNEINALPNTKA